MEKRNQLDAFEEFLLDEVNEHKMYPSSRVWANIRTEVHGNKSWPALTIMALTVLVALTVSTFIATQKSALVVLTNNRLKPKNTTNSLDKPFTTYQSSAQMIASKHALKTKVREVLSTMPLREMDIASTTRLSTSNGSNEMHVNNTLDETALLTDTKSERLEAANIISSIDPLHKINNTSLLPALLHAQVNHNFELAASTTQLQKKKKYSVQFYATPSASFRVLNAQKVKELIQPSLIAIPINSVYGQPPTFTQAVRHRPDIGLELGFTFNYPVTKRLQFKTGLQLNIRQ